MLEGLPDPISLVIVIVAVGAIPFAVVMLTAFVKIVCVLFIVRNALGVQQIPPNLVLYGVALVFTAFISAPMLTEMATRIEAANLDFETLVEWREAATIAAEPLRDFLIRFAEPEERAFFTDAAKRLWPPEQAVDLENDDLIVLIPAFVVSELTRAFEIGFLLYLPFIAIDLIVSNILLAMGMIMVSPIMIALPFKLFLFVLADGWNRLVHGLVLSYAI